MNIPTIVVVSISLLLMVLAIIFGWKITIKKFSIALYWVFCLIGAIVCLAFGFAGVNPIQDVFFAEGNINPLKILVIFLSCTSISVLLDKMGFFSYVAALILAKSKSSQTKLFFSFSAIIAILTIFTSNDILILTFTPFICYFAKHAKISPIPYILSEFVCANIWSMFFFIGNPTNIYMSMKYDIDFFTYAAKMAIPTMCCGLFATVLVYLLFRKTIKEKITIDEETIAKPEKGLITIGVTGLSLMIILMAVSNHLPGVELWHIPLICSGATFIASIICLAIKKEKMTIIHDALLGLPYALIPFLLSMSIFTFSLKEAGFMQHFANFLQNQNIYTTSLISFGMGNILNNIPMTMLFADTLVLVNDLPLNVVYATIAASNITALLTPIGSLAGIMFMKILKQNDVKYSFKQFILYGSIVSIPTILLAITLINFVNF